MREGGAHVTQRRAVVYLALAALALRLALMLARGDYLVYDEGYYLLLARSLRAGRGFTLNGLPHVALSPLQPVLVALLSAAGLPDLWASRLLAAACGALLVFPVAALARRAGGDAAGTVAAGLTAASPALMSFVPFFPGQSWNLYFGSEPLFLLLAFGAVAAAMRAETSRWWWWAATGALAGASYLTRAEGLVLAPALLAVVGVRALLRRGGLRGLRGVALAALAAAAVSAPYLLYLRSTLGRWALSGRVQAVQEGNRPTPSAVASARSGGEVLDAFVWQGEPDAFLRSLYALDPSGSRMASQYWGVHRAPATAVPAAPGGRATPPTRRPTSGAAPAPERRSALGIWWAGLGTVMPGWLALLAVAGFVLAARASLAWAIPLAAAGVVPSLLTYVEPRSLLTLAPLAAAFAAVTILWLANGLPRRWRPRAAWLLPALAALALVVPAVRDLARAWPGTTPLQRVASARRAVGEYLDRHLPAGAVVMSWHPAVAIWADRPWRVLPYEAFDRIVRYAEGEHAAAIVFSRFAPSPIRQPPRPFTVILPDSAGGGAAAGATVQLQRVDETPLLFVGRLAAVGGGR